jgi:ABC-type phosphate/phosphonate transport system permease subunit
MDVSGKPYEGWMTTIPLAVFLLFVVAAMGGPAAFANTVAIWITDLAHYVADWIKYF